MLWFRTVVDVHIRDNINTHVSQGDFTITNTWSQTSARKVNVYRALSILLLVALSTATRWPPRKNSVPFILNGNDADEGEWPHQCSFQSNSGFHFCGAVYIGNGWLATAAHCADGETPNSARAVCGVTSLSDSDDATEFDLNQVIEHPDYNFFTLENDHAILELTEVPDDANIVAVFADDQGGDAWVGSECWITGWGQDDTGGSPDRLQEAEVLALSRADCEDFYEGTGYDIYDDMICVGHDNDIYTGACYGDSGGPFVCRESADAAWTLIGVTSWAYPPCGADFYPSVYSRTAYFRDWISENCGGCI